MKSIKHIGSFFRPATMVSHNFLSATSAPQNYDITAIDEILIQNLPKDFQYFGCQDSDKTYRHFVTTSEHGTNDQEIISDNGKMNISSMEEVLATLFYLIQEDLKNCGPLHDVALQGQENLNVGYVMFPSGMHVVYIERLKRSSEEMAKYHIHTSPIPRKYKPGRNLLLKY